MRRPLLAIAVVTRAGVAVAVLLRSRAFEETPFPGPPPVTGPASSARGVPDPRLEGARPDGPGPDGLVKESPPGDDPAIDPSDDLG